MPTQQVRCDLRSSLNRSPQLHLCSSPACPAFSVLALEVIDSSMVSVSPDVGREGHAGKDVFAYFKNERDGNAVRNALTLRQMVYA